jgi:type IV secretory pathway TraG/TraD family ATPase VirD4
MKWGRNESVIWPPTGSIYTWGTIFFSFVLACAFVYLRFSFGLGPLQQFYLPYYLRAQTLGLMHKADKYQLLMVVNNSETFRRLAAERDVVPGSTSQYEGEPLPIHISKQAIADGGEYISRQDKTSYLNKSLAVWLQNAIYDGQSFWDIFKTPLLFGLLSLSIQLPFSIARDVARKKALRYGRRLRGTERLDPKEFNKKVQGDGLGIKTDDMKEMLRIPAKAEAQHIQVIGDTGAGKTTIILQALRQIQSRGESAIIYDPALEFTKRFYNPSRGDVILNPLDKRCPYWGPSEELLRRSEADAIAASLFQPPQDKKGEFFTEIPQQIFAHLLAYGPTPTELIEWMSNPAEIDRRVAGTEVANYIDPKAGPQRVGVLASLSKVAKSLRLLPTLEQSNGQEWSATSWAETREGWIFITSLPAERESLRPLQSVWIDMLVLRLLNEPKPGQKRVWFVLDELASLQRLPQLATALTENRKSNNPIILGFQGKAQLEVIYGHLAEVMLSQPSTSIYLKTKEPKAGEWISKAIGKVEIERMKETHFDGSRSGKNFSLDRQVEPLVLESEISGLPDLHAYLKYQNYVTGFSFPYLDVMPTSAVAFEPRELENDQLIYDPKNLRGAASTTGTRNARQGNAHNVRSSPFQDLEKPLEPPAPVNKPPARKKAKERLTETLPELPLSDNTAIPYVSQPGQEQPPAITVEG